MKRWRVLPRTSRCQESVSWHYGLVSVRTRVNGTLTRQCASKRHHLSHWLNGTTFILSPVRCILCAFVCIYIYIYVYTYIYIHTYIYVHMYIFIYVYIHIHIYMYVYIYEAYIWSDVYIWSDACMCIYMKRCMYVYIYEAMPPPDTD